MKNRFVVLSIALLCIFLFSTFAAAQLPIGNVSNPTSASCSGFEKKAVCTQYTVTCPNIAPATVIIGVNTGGAPILLIDGSGWTLPGSNDFASAYITAGYTVFEARWSVPWELVGTGYTPNLMNAACLGATLISYIANGSPIAVQGGSAGSSVIAYALSWYGLSNLVSVAEMASGPVFSNVEMGCETPLVGNVTIIPTNGEPWTDFPNYAVGIPTLLTTYTGYTCEPKKASSGTANQAWLNQSINAPGGQTSFPTTYISLWLCATAQTVNNSSAQGYLWASTVTTPWNLTALTGCSGDENPEQALTPQGETGFNAITADLEQNYPAIP
jgi:hypothetical protein